MPDIAKPTVAYPEGQIKLDKIYGAVDPAVLKEYEARIPEVIKVSGEFFADIHDVLANVRKNVTTLIQKRIENLGAGEEAQKLQYAISNPVPTNIRGLVSEDYSHSPSTLSSREESILRSAGISSSSAISDAKGLGADEFKESLKAALQPAKAKIQMFEEVLLSTVGNKALVGTIKEKLPENYAGTRDSLRNFEAEVRVIDIADVRKAFEAESLAQQMGDLRAKVADASEFVREEAKFKGLFLGELDRMLVEKGHSAGAAQLFVEPSKGAIPFQAGSRPLVMLVDYSPEMVEMLKAFNSTSESTTQYHMFPNFAIHDFKGTGASPVSDFTSASLVTQPTFGIDAKAVTALREFGVNDSQLLNWTKNYLRAATMVEHDYLHRLVIPQQDAAPVVFAEKSVLPKELFASNVVIPDSHQPTGHLEDHALATHAQVLKRLFDASPARKEAVLARAAESYVQLAAIQQTALANAHDDAARVRVNEAVTYLAEIESHRVFRAFASDDVALKTPVQVVTPQGTKTMSVAEAMNGVQLVSPDRLQATTAGKSGFETLVAHAQDRLGDTYTAIHHMNSFPMIAKGEMERAMNSDKTPNFETNSFTIADNDKIKGIIYKDALLVISDAHQTAIARSANPEASRKIAEERTAQVLEAQRLRTAGDSAGALRIESELRRPIAPVEPLPPPPVLVTQTIVTDPELLKELKSKRGDGQAVEAGQLVQEQYEADKAVRAAKRLGRATEQAPTKPAFTAGDASVVDAVFDEAVSPKQQHKHAPQGQPPQVSELANKGYGIFHALPTVHPEENSPITKEGLQQRVKIIAALNPSLSTSSFQEGIPAIGRPFGDSVVSVLAGTGSITTASTMDNGTTVADNGGRVASRHDQQVTAEQLARTLQSTAPTHDKDNFGRAPGYNELAVEGVKPAAIVINLDRLLASKMEAAHISTSATPTDSMLAHMAAALKGEGNPVGKHGGKVLTEDFWAGFTHSAAASYEKARQYAAIAPGQDLPVYALVDGQLHSIQGRGAAHQKTLQQARGSNPEATAYSFEFRDAIGKDAALAQHIGGQGKPLIDRLAPLLAITPEATPLRDVVANTPELSRATRAALAAEVRSAFKPEHQPIIDNALASLAPTEGERRAAYETAETARKSAATDSVPSQGLREAPPPLPNKAIVPPPLPARVSAVAPIDSGLAVQPPPFPSTSPSGTQASARSTVTAGPDAANNESIKVGHVQTIDQGNLTVKPAQQNQPAAVPQLQQGQTTNVGRNMTAANDAPLRLQQGQMADVGQSRAPAANDARVPIQPKAESKPATSGHATRAGGAAGGAMGIAGIAGRVENTLAKAAQVGGEQLRTERTALAGDVASVITGAADMLPGASGALRTAVATGARVAPIVAAGAAYLEVQAANTAQDGRRGSAAIGGFVAGMGTGIASGAAAGSVFGPWGTAIGGIVGGLGAGYVGSEVGRTSQWGDQRQRDLDHKAQHALDQSVEVIGELGRKRLRGEAWNDADKAAVRTIGGLMVEHVNRLQVLDIPATDIDGKLRQNYQLQQAQQVVDYLNGRTERLPMTSQERDAHLIPSLDALLPVLNDAKLGWKPHLDVDKSGKVDRTDVLGVLQKYGVELHTLDKDGRSGVTIAELTQVLKALNVDKEGRVTPTHGASRTERAPEIRDETHANFRDGLTESSGAGQKRFVEAMAAWIPELEKSGFAKTIGHNGKITIDELSEAMKRNGIRPSDVDRDSNGNINEREAIAALKAFGLNMSEQTAVAAAPITPVNTESINPRSRN